MRKKSADRSKKNGLFSLKNKKSPFTSRGILLSFLRIPDSSDMKLKHTINHSENKGVWLTEQTYIQF